jgi:hypothetical protein
VVEELYYVIKGDPLEIRREGDDVNVIFWWEGFRLSGSGYIIQLIKKYRRY